MPNKVQAAIEQSDEIPSVISQSDKTAKEPERATLSEDTANDALEVYFSKNKKLANKIIKRLQQEVFKLGFQKGEITIKRPDEAIYRLEKDTLNNKYSLIGDWRDEKGIKIGSLLFHAEGNFFVEYDIIKAHPNDKRFFVEAVNAWGKSGRIKAEAKLIPSLGQ